jgi:hypothetical protein
MYRRMSLGLILLFLFVILAVPTPASAEPLASSEATVVESFDLLDWAWEWLTSLVSDSSGSTLPEGGGALNGLDGGGFMDPNGGNG